MILRYRFSIWLLGGVLCSARSASQSADTGWADIEFIRQSHGWLSSGQATGLQFVPVNKLSVATLDAQKANGNFKNFYHSNNSYTLNASTESFYRLNERVVFQGKIDYEYFQGKNMGGSVLMDPYKYSMDLDEYTDSTAGTKKTEQYLLMGAISAQISRKLNLAGSINYVAANYTKTKDLRHINKLLDLDAQIGASYQLTNKLMIGMSYTYSRRIETSGFKVFGNAGRQYLTLINFGSFYGLSELYTETYGYTSQTNPFINMRHTGALQFAWTINTGLKFFQQLSYQQRSGYFGKKGSSSVVYTEDNGDQYASTSVLTLSKNQSVQHFKISAAYETVENFENVYQISTPPGGSSIITYYGQNKVLTQDRTILSAGYTGFWKIKDNQPLWSIQADIDYTTRTRSAVRYPYFRKQEINNYGVHATGKRNWKSKTLLYTTSIGLGYASGFGTAKNDGLYAQPSSSQVPPASKDNYLYEEYEYFTSPRTEISPALQVGREVNKRVFAFVKLSFSYTRAFDTIYNGKNFRRIGLNIGCYF